MNIEDCRRFYSEEVRIAAGLKASPLIEAFARVPREHFIGPPPWQIASPDMAAGEKGYVTTENPQDLYHNVLVALDPKRHLNNGQPSALAHWIDALHLQEGERVFHLGSGTGYYTAILAEVVGASGGVAAIEVDPDLAARAQENLKDYRQVTVYAGDGAVFDPGACDAIFVNAGVTHPQTIWLDRLKPGGRLVLPLTATLGSVAGQGTMLRIIRGNTDFWNVQTISYVAIFSCTGARDPQLEPVVEKAVKSRALQKIRCLRRDRHEQTDTCIVHGPESCFSSIVSLSQN